MDDEWMTNGMECEMEVKKVSAGEALLESCMASTSLAALVRGNEWSLTKEASRNDRTCGNLCNRNVHVM
jgi:hypothetical protein